MAIQEIGVALRWYAAGLSPQHIPDFSDWIVRYLHKIPILRSQDAGDAADRSLDVLKTFSELLKFIQVSLHLFPVLTCESQ